MLAVPGGGNRPVPAPGGGLVDAVEDGARPGAQGPADVPVATQTQR